MKTLVVGGAGFIGSHLCDALLVKGHSVACVDDLSRGMRKNIAHLEGNGFFSFYQADASKADALSKVFSEYMPEYVFHLAANSDIQASAANPAIEYQRTYTTTFQVLSCMRKYKTKRLFFASTSAVYGDKKEATLDENTPNLSPISYYGAAKLGSEALIHAFSYMNDLSSLVFRFPNVIGPRLTHGVIFDFVRKLEKNSQELEILGDGKQTKPYLYVADLVDAIIMMMNRNGMGVSLYNVGVESGTSVTRIADILCEEMGLSDVVYRYTGGNAGWKGDVPRFCYSLEKIHEAGWAATNDSDGAVRKTVRAVIGKA